MSDVLAQEKRKTQMIMNGLLEGSGSALHMPQLPKRFHASSFILRATSALGDRGGSQFDDDLWNRRCA
jgi:hypothetical protein